MAKEWVKLFMCGPRHFFIFWIWPASKKVWPPLDTVSERENHLKSQIFKYKLNKYKQKKLYDVLGIWVISVSYIFLLHFFSFAGNPGHVVDNQRLLLLQVLPALGRPDGRHRPHQFFNQLHHLFFHVKAIQKNIPRDVWTGKNFCSYPI